MRGRRHLLLWLVPAGLLACAVAMDGRRAPVPDAPEPPRPTMNHALHAARDLLCTDCHDPEETGEPALPDPATCFDCHEEDLAKESDRVQAYFMAIRQADGAFRFTPLPYSSDLVMPHKAHAAAEVDCASCHGEPAETAFTRPAPLALKATCMDCHTEQGASNECATCHKETRKDVAPPSHDAGFRVAHGAQAPAGWRDGQGASCALCHAVPQDCDACHRESPPQSHREAGFLLSHGKDTDAPFEAWEEASCALCHEEQSCVRCHQTTKPRSHTTPWMRRLHGITAAVDRQSCKTCHQQDFCQSCHETTQPLSHRGSFARGPQTHCVACHEPLTESGCFACHKHTRGHLGHTPPPADTTHLAARDPGDCAACHTVLPHLDDGGRCRRCHR